MAAHLSGVMDALRPAPVPASPGKQPQDIDFKAFLSPAGEDGERMELAVENIHCAGCMAAIEREMAKAPGVRHARVNLAQRRLTLEWTAGRADPGEAIRLLGKIGFPAFPFAPSRTEAADAAEMRRLIRALGVAAFAMMNIMLLSVVVWSGHQTGLDAATRDFMHGVSGIIALPAAAYSGQPFFSSALTALKARRVNMDVPISLGIILALALSVAQTLNHGEHAYFDSAVMLIFFLLIGRVLERAMLKRTRSVAANVAALRGETMLKRMPDGAMRDTPADMVEPGDIVLIRAGDRIGVDGVIEAGASDIDRSLVTGETAAHAVKPGDQVHAGALNLTGVLTVRALKSHDGTLLADVERLLAKATETRGAYVKLADRAAQLYAPFVHTAALATFIGWMLLGLGWQEALVIAITVLIITCPCALGLAVPAVQVVASGAMFRAGVLANRGDALERLAAADVAVFDKTGTLTLPDAEIANRAEIDDATLARAGRLALASSHPMSRVIAKAAGACQPFATAREVPGEGVAGCRNGRTMKLGSAAYCGREAEAAALQRRWPDASIVAFTDGGAHALFAVRQPLRPDAAEALADVAKLGLSVEILSGDRPEAVSAAACELGLPAHAAGATPAQKVARLDALRAQGHHVLMVGDGLNDAAALAAAHVSIAPVSATHLAQTQADFVVLGKRLGPVPAAIRIARKAKRLMMQNLWLSVVYNAVAVPIAVAGHATPLVAALAMSGSSVLVTLNALRARNAGGAS
jgi:P-type Cu2+ transporter